MHPLQKLLDNNKTWADKVKKENPSFFSHLAQQQSPKFLWIGCSDSRVPANQITGLEPGQVFVHRNVANLVVKNDLNCLSVMQYAVDVLKVEHIIVCGHYGCGGVLAALRHESLGLIDGWLKHLGDIRDDHEKSLAAISNEALKHDRLWEINVIEQALNVCKTGIVQNAWARGQTLSVHGWVYRLTDGLLHDMKGYTSSTAEMLELEESVQKMRA
jgi:carbonic anhydrase